MSILLLLPLLFGNFVQKWYIPQGMIGECGRLLICDTDRDGNYEFFFPPYGWAQKIYIYELHLPDTWQVDSFSYLFSPLMWDVGDFDLDGLMDLVIDASATQGYPTMVISIAESPDSFSYPTQEVWRDTVGSALVTPICAYDIDQDGFPEIVKVLGDYIHLHIYESIGDNLYDKIAEITTSSTYNSSSTLAFGDFDLDGRNEFVWGYSGGEYSIWECTGNNSYQEIVFQQLPTVNIKDCFAVPDADGDGKMEFVVKGFVVPTARIHAFIFEATGDNTYEIIQSFDLFGGDYGYYGGYSDVGDVDGDGIPEIVLEACQNVYIIKAAGNDSFYVWDYIYGNYSGSNVRVFDIDGNGLCEIIISGNNQTRIYEYVVGITETTDAAVQGLKLDIYPNPFVQFLNIKFQNPIEKEVEVKIYDVAGRLTKILHKGIVNRDCILTWHGDDEQGKAVAPGVYLIRLDSQGDRETKKVILLK